MTIEDEFDAAVSDEVAQEIRTPAQAADALLSAMD